MKKLTPLTILVVLVMFSSSCFAAWKQVDENDIGNIYYVDFKSIKKHDLYVNFWRLTDYSKPNKSGILSTKAYNQVDCRKFRYKTLRYSFHKEPMGGGSGIVGTSGKTWDFPHPNSSLEIVLKAVCKHTN